MMSNQELSLIEIPLQLLQGLDLAANSDYFLRLLLKNIGWNVEKLNELHADDFVEKVGSDLSGIITAVDGLEALTELKNKLSEGVDLPEIYKQSLLVIKAFNDARHNLVELAAGLPVGDSLGGDESFKQLGSDILSYLINNYVQGRFPEAYALADLLGIVTQKTVSSVVDIAQADRVLREAASWPVFGLSRLWTLLKDPNELLKEFYLNDSPLSSDNLPAVADEVFGRLVGLLYGLGIKAVYGMMSGLDPDLSDADPIAERMLTIYLGRNEDEDFGLTLAIQPSSEVGDDYGLVVVPFGTLNGKKSELKDWTVTYKLDPEDIEAWTFNRGTIETLPESDRLVASFEATRNKKSDDLPVFLFGSPEKPALSIDNISITGAVKFEDSKPASELKLVLGKGQLAIPSLLNVTWDEVGILCEITETAVRSEVNITGLKIEPAAWMSGIKLEASQVKLVFINGVFQKGVDNAVQNNVDCSFITMIKPIKTTFKLAGFDFDGEKLTFDLGNRVFAPIANSDFAFGWESISLALFTNSGHQYLATIDFEKLTLGTNNAVLVDTTFGLAFQKPGNNPPLKITNPTLDKPAIEDLAIQEVIHIDGSSFMLRLDRTQEALKNILGLGIPGILPKLDTDNGDPIVVRVLFGEDGPSFDFFSYEELRIDWLNSTEESYAIPGINLTFPEKTQYSLIFRAQDRKFSNAFFIATFRAAKEITVTSSFAWERPISGESDKKERELLNDASPPKEEPGEEEKPSDEFFKLTLTPVIQAPPIGQEHKQGVSLMLANVDLTSGGLPTFFRQVESNSPLIDLAHLNLQIEKDLKLYENADRQWTDVPLKAKNWLTDFTFDAEALKFPFLASNNSSQFIEITSIEDKIDLTKAKLELILGLKMQVVETLKLSADISAGISLETFALSFDVADGLTLRSRDRNLNGELLGLTWRFQGKEKEDNGKPYYEFFKLHIKDYDYRIEQIEGCKLEIDYNMMGEEPVTFEVENFELGEKGVTLLAKVTGKPAKLNGIGTRFTFRDSSFEIVENEIQSFTLMGSGPVPPALLGDGTADIALQFEQRDGSLQLVSGAAKLQGIKELQSKETSFQYAIDALGLKFVNDGAIHLYFTITGSASYVAKPGDDGPLALLSRIKLELVDCPVTGNISVLGKHINFLIPLPKPVEFSFLGAFAMEVRGIGLYPQAEVFGEGPALLLAGQVRFAEGGGDAASTEIDHHRLFIGRAKPGEVLPQVHLSELPLNINMGEAFKLTGAVSFVDDELMTGFSGEGVMQIKGLPTMAAAFSFLRVRHNELSGWLRAWFIYLEVRQVSFPVPVVQLYLREVGLGFGYRYTLASIKAADKANDLGELIGQLEKLSRTQGNLATRAAWDVDLEEPGESARWTVVLRALISQTTASTPTLGWNKDAEEKATNTFLFDAVIALRSDFTFFMAVRAWLNTNYYAVATDDKIRSSPLFSGFVLITPKKKRLLAHLASNPDGHTGSNPKLPELVVRALKNGEFSATLLIEPGLLHYEMGWPNQLRWSGKIGIIDAEFRGGFIMRVSESEIVIGNSFLARGTAKIGASVDLGFVGAEITAVATVAFGSRYIGVLFFQNTGRSAFYGAIGLEAHLDLSFRAWIRFQIRINLGFKKITITIQKDFRLSATADFTASVEVGILLEGKTGARGHGTLAVNALGHRLEMGISLTANGDIVTQAYEATKQFLDVGLEASDVEPVPGIPGPGGSGRAHEEAVAFDAQAGQLAQGVLEEAVMLDAAEFALLQEELESVLSAPEYVMFIIRQENRAYFAILPKGEDESGFLPPPPRKRLELDDNEAPKLDANGLPVFRLLSDLPGTDYTDDFEVLFQLDRGVKLNRFDAYALEGHGDFVAMEEVVTETGVFQWKASWKANWKAKMGEADSAVEDDGSLTTENMNEPIKLHDYLLPAYRTIDSKYPDSNNPPENIKISVKGEDFEISEEYAVADPIQPGVPTRMADERVSDPGESAYEAAVRGAMQQFRGSPFFKRDENYEYDRLLTEAFKENNSIYEPAANEEDAADVNVALRPQDQRARQVRGVIIQDIIEDLRAYVDNPEYDIKESLAFQMGLIFCIEPAVENDELVLPDWLDSFVENNYPTIRQRQDPAGLRPLSEKKAIRPFNVSAARFHKNPPTFDRVRHYSTANTIALAWDLTWPSNLPGASSRVLNDPEQHLHHYNVRRRALGTNERDVERTMSPVQILHRNGRGLIGLKPRFQIVDHFNEETLEEQAAMPVYGREYIYTITPVDFEGNPGRPMTLLTARYPDEPPQVPADARLTIQYEIPDPTTGETDDKPLLLTPKDISASWTRPRSKREGPVVAVAKYYLVFRRENTLPIGSYGLDAETEQSKAKSLPSSTAVPRENDIRISFLRAMVKPSDDPEKPSSYRQTKAELNLVEKLRKANVFPGDSSWRPEAWRVYLQAEAHTGVQSALVPVRLVLQACTNCSADDAGDKDRFDEWPVDALEWLPRESSLTLPLLPPEDATILPSNAHVPMPVGGDGSYETFSKIYLWDLDAPSSDEPHHLQGAESRVLTLTFSPNGRWLVGRCNDGVTRRWDLDNMLADPQILPINGYEIKSIVSSPDGKWVAVESFDNTVYFWDMNNLTAKPQLLTYDGETLAMDIGKIGSVYWLAAGSSDAKVRLWDMEDMQHDPQHVLNGHSGSILSLAFSPDGNLLASGSSDNTTRLWNIEDPQNDFRILEGHILGVKLLAFSPNGLRLATGSLDKTVRLWDLSSTDKALAIAEGHMVSLRGVTFKADGNWLVSDDYDNTVLTWNIQDLEPDPTGPVNLKAVTLKTGGQEGAFMFGYGQNGRWFANSTEASLSLSYQPHPAGKRLVRFRWNQGPSHGQGQPLDLYAGYHIWKLDADAHTTKTFEDAALLAGALKHVQEVRMSPAGDLPLTPSDTLATSQWEAWYPSFLRRWQDGKNTQIEGAEAGLGAWYSWRDSQLVWPVWDQQGKMAVRNKALHPLFESLVETLQEKINDKPRYIVEAQGGPPMKPIELTEFMSLTGPKPDPYGWGILQRLGLSVVLILRDADSGELVDREATLQLLMKSLAKVLALPGYANLKPHLAIELLIQPAQSTSLEIAELKTAELNEKLLAAVQLSLRPTVKQTRHYGRMLIKGRASSEIQLVLPKHSTKRTMIVQSVQSGERDKEAARGQQIEIDEDEPFQYTLTLPPTGETMVLFRVQGDWENWDPEGEPRASLLLAPRQPLSEFQQNLLESIYENLFANTYGQGDLAENVPEGSILIKETTTGKKPADAIKELNAAIAADNENEKFNLTTVEELFSIEMSLPEEIFIAGESYVQAQGAEKYLGHLASYFTVPDIEVLVEEFAADPQWKILQSYLHSLNSPDPNVKDKIVLPDLPVLPENTTEATLKILTDVLEWLQRFFDHTGEVVRNGSAVQTGSGPWLVTAYPRAGSPAYSTPDDGGRLRYDHLMEDRWAHNYRYYIQPYSRYDGLWRSFRQSRALYPDKQERSAAVASWANVMISRRSIDHLRSNVEKSGVLISKLEQLSIVGQAFKSKSELATALNNRDVPEWNKIADFADKIDGHYVVTSRSLRAMRQANIESLPRIEELWLLDRAFKGYAALDKFLEASEFSKNERAQIRDAAERIDGPAPELYAGGLDLVVDRTYPLDQPLVLSSQRLDGKDAQPGRTWEVIVAKHKEQILVERNQTLSRQLSYRQLAFTLQRRFTDSEWIKNLQSMHQAAFTDPEDKSFEFAYVDKKYPALPANLSQRLINAEVVDVEFASSEDLQQALRDADIENEAIERIMKIAHNKGEGQDTKWQLKKDTIFELDAPDHLLVDEGRIESELDRRDVALPHRIKSFQQGAVALQWQGLPYYYAHRLLLVAQATSVFSPVTSITKRDFEYRSPEPLIYAWGTNDESKVNASVRTLRLILARYWDCLPEEAQSRWPSENPEEFFNDKKRKLSSLPDPEVVYQLVESFGGNLEVQVEIKYDPEMKSFKARQLGPKFNGPDEDDPKSFPLFMKMWPEEEIEGAPQRYALELTIVQNGDKAPLIPKKNSVLITQEIDPIEGLPQAQIETRPDPHDNTKTEIWLTFEGFMSENQARKLHKMFSDNEDDQNEVQKLFEMSVQTGFRDGELKLRTQRGAAMPFAAQSFKAPEIKNNSDD